MLNKEKLSKKVAEKLDASKKDIREIIEETFRTISEELINDVPVSIVNFGTFEVRSQKPKKGRNPKTGEEIAIPESKTPAFSASKTLKYAVKGR